MNLGTFLTLTRLNSREGDRTNAVGEEKLRAICLGNRNVIKKKKKSDVQGVNVVLSYLTSHGSGYKAAGLVSVA